MNKDHLGTVAGMIEFVTKFTSQQAIGEYGYLPDKGLIALKMCDAEWSAGTVETLPLVDVAVHGPPPTGNIR